MVGSTLAINITTMWIKNSPCAECSKVLVRFFKNCDNKPEIYVGRTWHPKYHANREGLIQLMRQGFKISVWEEFHLMMYGKKNTNIIITSEICGDNVKRIKKKKTT